MFVFFGFLCSRNSGGPGNSQPGGFRGRKNPQTVPDFPTSIHTPIRHLRVSVFGFERQGW
jgi:hypothetical protein